MAVQNSRTKAKLGRAPQPAGWLHSSLWVSHSKSLTLRRRSAGRGSHRGGVVPHPPRQGLLPSNAPPRATSRDSVAACDISIFSRSFREHEALPPTSHTRDRPAPRSGTDSTPRRLVGVLFSRILHKDREAHVVQSSPPMLRRKVVLEARNSALPRENSTVKAPLRSRNPTK